MQLPSETAEFIRSGQRVTVCEPLDGVLRVFAGEAYRPDRLQPGPEAGRRPSMA